MKFNFGAYEKLYPRTEKKPEKTFVDPEDKMTTEEKIEEKPEEKKVEVLEDGNTGTSESDPE